VVGQPGRGGLDRGRLLLAQGGVLGPLGLAQVDQARPLTPAPLLLAREVTRLRAVTMA
jgi:hypothetical protein